ncbi:TOBE domain-containing protein [Phormidesmis priestleyi]
MNFLRVPCDGNTAIVGSTRIPLPHGTVAPREIILGLRPEHVHLSRSTEESALKGQVFLVENLGMHNLISIKVENANGEPITIRALMEIHQGISAGNPVKLSIPIEEIHWFDAETGDRITNTTAREMVRG